MKVKIISVGKLKEKYLQQGVNEYLKRLQPYARVEIVEVSDEKAPETLSAAEMEMVKQKEGERIARFISPASYCVALAIDGVSLSSEEFAEKLQKLALSGCSDITFIIGGSLGLSDEILGRADMRLSFSRFTFPHQLMRLILLEQIYRGFKIIRGEPYHK